MFMKRNIIELTSFGVCFSFLFDGLLYIINYDIFTTYLLIWLLVMCDYVTRYHEN